MKPNSKPIHVSVVWICFVWQISNLDTLPRAFWCFLKFQATHPADKTTQGDLLSTSTRYGKYTLRLFSNVWPWWITETFPPSGRVRKTERNKYRQYLSFNVFYHMFYLVLVSVKDCFFLCSSFWSCFGVPFGRPLELHVVLPAAKLFCHILDV